MQVPPTQTTRTGAGQPEAGAGGGEQGAGGAGTGPRRGAEAEGCPGKGRRSRAQSRRSIRAMEAKGSPHRGYGRVRHRHGAEPALCPSPAALRVPAAAPGSSASLGCEPGAGPQASHGDSPVPACRSLAKSPACAAPGLLPGTAGRHPGAWRRLALLSPKPAHALGAWLRVPGRTPRACRLPGELPKAPRQAAHRPEDPTTPSPRAAARARQEEQNEKKQKKRKEEEEWGREGKRWRERAGRRVAKGVEKIRHAKAKP